MTNPTASPRSLEDKIIVKRDGREVPFRIQKIVDAISKAAQATDVYVDAQALAQDVVATLPATDQYTVEEVQNVVERILIKHNLAELAKEYILYRQKRTDLREMKSAENQVIRSLVFSDSQDSDTKRENANIDGDATISNILSCGLAE